MDSTTAERANTLGQRGAATPHDVVELNFLLTERQVTLLDRAAHNRGETMGQLLRRLIEGSLVHDHGPDTAT